MQLTRSTDLALRALMLVAVDDRHTTVADLAGTLGIPATHMAKLVQRLRTIGVLTTSRGRHGGVRLAPGALDTAIGPVVRRLEGDDEVVDCDPSACPLRPGCLLRDVLRRAQEAFYAELDDVRLGDLVRPPAAATLLALTASRP